MLEDQLLDALPVLLATGDPSVFVGTGPDDCAHVRTDGTRLAMTIDSFTEGSHFLADTPAAAIAEKAMAATLSDLAASGCRARWVLTSLCLRPGLPDGWAREFALAMAETAKRYGVTVVGGDTVSGKSVCVTMTAVGEPWPGGPILRSGAHAGDVVAVSGTLGGSLKGRHLRPVPRLEEMRLILEFCREKSLSPPSAAMDISDGLTLDLSRLCEESGVGARIREADVPVSAAAVEMAGEDGASPLHHAFADGEDFELVLTFAPATWAALLPHWQRVVGESPSLAPLTAIGECTADGQLLAIDAAGSEHPLAAEGYQHQW